MIILYSTVLGKVMNLEVSATLYGEIRSAASKKGLSFHGIVSKAWERYGVSEEAIWQYLENLRFLPDVQEKPTGFQVEDGVAEQEEDGNPRRNLTKNARRKRK